MLAPVRSYFAPGKLILLGEHGVVYGHPALAAAISRGVHAHVEPSDRLQLELPEGLSDGQRAALERAFAVAAKRTRNPKLSVSLQSDLPLSMGLGSSGALSVAVAEVLDDDTLDPKVVAPHPLDQLGDVATLHEDAARLGYPGARFGNRE